MKKWNDNARMIRSKRKFKKYKNKNMEWNFFLGDSIFEKIKFEISFYFIRTNETDCLNLQRILFYFLEYRILCKKILYHLIFKLEIIYYHYRFSLDFLGIKYTNSYNHLTSLKSNFYVNLKSKTSNYQVLSNNSK